MKKNITDDDNLIASQDMDDTENMYSDEQKIFSVSSLFAGKRLDKVLSELVPEHSRSFLKSLIESGNVSVNGKAVTKGSYTLSELDEIILILPPPKELDIKAENIPLDILYEDDDVLVVNKPKGMVVHPAAGHYEGTLVNAVMFHCGDNLSGINGVMRPGIVHRIDKDTTGSVIICKNDKAHNSIATQLKEHSIKRVYLAIVYGIIDQDEGTVEGPIGRHPTDRKKMAINERNGKPAVTHYKVLQRFTRNRLTLIECRLETGRTHQIRVHMSSIGHPLLGDDVYAGNRKSPWKLQGQCLHAQVLGFIHPTTGEYVETIAPMPDYMTHLIQIIE